MNYFFAFPLLLAGLVLSGASDPYIFATACIAIIPFAHWMGIATEHLSERAGAGLGGLLNATFGNAAELIIALLALQRGLEDVVKASITGSIVGNLLLVLGLSIIVGGLRHKIQKFDRTAVGLSSTLLVLSAAALLLPAAFHAIVGEQIRLGALTHLHKAKLESDLSREIGIVLFFVYVLHLIFSLRTHKEFFGGKHAEPSGKNQWSVARAVTVLIGATVGVTFVSEALVHAVEHTAEAWGMNSVFIGVVVVAVVGNAAEHSTALVMAAKDKMDLAVHIAIGSSLQIALFVAPILLLASALFGRPMNLLFTPLEVLSVVLAVVVTHLVVQDGESNWMEGTLLVALYVMLAFAFYLLPV